MTEPTDSRPAMSLPTPSKVAETSNRLSSIDIYRGMVMFLMLAEMLHLGKFADLDFEGGVGLWLANIGFWNWLQFHTTHVEWTGCSLHDLIQPGFSFLVGVALPFSLQARIAKQQSLSLRLWHAFWRSLILVFLGIFLRSLAPQYDHTNFTFDDTLTQIGLGYFFLFAISLAPRWMAGLCFALILAGYWLAFVLFPLPATDFDPATRGVPANWSHHFEGLAAHWNKNANLATTFDRWFLNLFPRVNAFEFHRGGYATLSFIPTLATMLMGLFAGRWLLEPGSFRNRALFLASMGLLSMVAAWMLDRAGVCPIVKRIWTPSWVLWSGGICCFWLLILHWICDVLKMDGWGFAWKVIGANSIAAYVMEWTMRDWIQLQFKKHLYWDPTTSTLGPAVAQSAIGAATLLVFWWILYYMYRRKIFIKI